jgi:hypothetical protein
VAKPVRPPATPTAVAEPRQLPRLPQGDTQVPRLNPKVAGDVTIATRQLLEVKTLPQAKRDEVADFLVRSNPETYANRAAAVEALTKTDQIYAMRDAQGQILATATLTRTSQYEWYLGQVAARSGAGGDVMKWLLGDFKQLARHSGHPVRIWAYTNKAENVYNTRNPSQPGFYAQLGAHIIDPHPAGKDDLSTRRRIDIEWRFDAKGQPVRPEPTPRPPPNQPKEANSPQGTLPPTAPPALNSNFTNQPLGDLTFSTGGTQPFGSPSLPVTMLDQAVLGTAVLWNSFRPIAGPIKFIGDGLSNLTRPLSEAVVNIPKHIWNALPESTRTSLAEIWLGQPSTTMPNSDYENLDPRMRDALRNTVVVPDEAWNSLSPEMQQHLSKAAQGNLYTIKQELRHGELLRQAPLDLPLGIGPSIEWVFVGRDGKESLITKIATTADRLWQSPPVEIAMGTAKVIGFVAHRGATALMVVEAAAGGPKLHVYDPTSNQPITEPSLAALTIGYVPKTDGTLAVTLQGSLVPEASYTLWVSGPVMRDGIPRADNKKTADGTVQRIISTWTASLGTMGTVMKIGTPNLHWMQGITVRPLGEFGANPLVGQATTQRVLEPDSTGKLVPKVRGAIDGYSLGVIDPLGYLSTTESLRVGPMAITPDRVSVGLGSGYKVSAGTSGLSVNQTAYVPQAPASVFQLNPAFNWQMSETAPVAGAVSADGKHLQAVWSVDANNKPTVGLFVRTKGAFQIETQLYVDPATGWMAVASPNAATPPLWVHYGIANAAKVTGQARGGRFDATAFDANWRQATADQWLQALQTGPGRVRVISAIQQLGGGDVEAGLRQLSAQVTDPNVRRLIEGNAAYFKALMQSRS